MNNSGDYFLDIKGIMAILPHAYPFLLIDRVISFDAGVSILCLKNVSYNELFFTGHFPDHPVMPGVLILEAMAQASALCAFLSHRSNNNYDPQTGAKNTCLFTNVKDARFTKQVIPGDSMEVSAVVKRLGSRFSRFTCRCNVGSAVVAEAEIGATLMTQDRS